jgi:cytidylate kinase
MIIVIDGPAGTGKSTIAQRLAERLEYLFLDTGAMYRSVAFGLQSQGIDTNDENKVANYLNDLDLAIEKERFLLDGIDITDKIRTPEISSLTSTISALPVVREQIVPLQRRLVKGYNAVAEGRDLGTVVFPHADLKIYLTADPEVRAQRRLLQQKGNINDTAALAATKEAIETRDTADISRAHSPLKRADDAVIIDTSDLTIEEVLEKIVEML